MQLAEALRWIRQAPSEALAFETVLACGFTPLHLKTFLHAALQRHFGLDRRVIVREGVFEDLAGTIESTLTDPPQSLAVFLEWADLDPRLGFRSSGVWGNEFLRQAPALARTSLDRFSKLLLAVDPAIRIVLSLPQLPLPPLFAASGCQMSLAESSVRARLAEFAEQLATQANIFILQQADLPADRYDFQSDLYTGFPFSRPFAAKLAIACAHLVVPPAPHKGLITDLDDTLWSGIAGEIGANQVSWALADHHHVHALYQKQLAALAEEGVLLAIASKNSVEVVDQALSRSDLLIDPSRFFPIEANWGAKSQSVSRILSTWNIAAESVVFVDDSPLERAEVAAAHPGILCLELPLDNYSGAFDFLQQLRNCFGKPALSAEDALRLDSIRASAHMQEARSTSASPEDFLAQAEARLDFDFAPDPSDLRLLDLVNKTNQFNLNGRRFTSLEWSDLLARPGAFIASVQYKDKFGPLGKIAVLAGVATSDAFSLDVWVLSCRAFTRRIEFACLRVLWDRIGSQVCRFDFAPTARNGPLRDFFASMSGEAPAGPFELDSTQFSLRCPQLHHKVSVTPHV